MFSLKIQSIARPLNATIIKSVIKHRPLYAAYQGTWTSFRLFDILSFA